MSQGDRHFILFRSQARSIRRLGAASAFAGLAAVSVALEHGFREPVAHPLMTGVLQCLLPWVALVLAGDVRWKVADRSRWRGPFGAIGEVGVALGLVFALAGGRVLPELVAVASVIAFAIRINSVLARTMRNPTILFPASFLVLIGVSAALLKLPAATPIDKPISLVDAVFTATSAVCVTGLAVRDTATEFTLFGQAVVLGSIQLGGLGVMIFGSTLALLFGARLSFKEHVTLSMALDEYPAHRIARFAWFIVLTTLVLEAIGAVILYLSWPGDELAHGTRLWYAVFHSISAFCNAGFDITGQSLVGIRSSVAAYLGIMPMIILGGIGFVVLEDLYRLGRDRLGNRAGRGRDRARLGTHSRIVLATTACLLVGGFVTIFFAQSSAAGGASLQTALDAAFMSTTARTAGFTTVAMEDLSSGSRFTLMVLMSIGGSPGSTAGGMKTVVFAILVLSILSTVRGRSEVEVFGRALSDALVKKAATVAAGLFGVITLATLALDLTERIAFEPLFFEVISAASTTGLSLGATGELSDPGRIIITITMFLGRVGALSLLAALIGATGVEGRYRLPRDTVSLG
ncbi:MAG: TrkH family potassium uptake protein [Phycisphaerales bacterium JB037]